MPWFLINLVLLVVVLGSIDLFLFHQHVSLWAAGQLVDPAFQEAVAIGFIVGAALLFAVIIHVFLWFRRRASERGGVVVQSLENVRDRHNLNRIPWYFRRANFASWFYGLAVLIGLPVFEMIDMHPFMRMLAALVWCVIASKLYAWSQAKPYAVSMTFSPKEVNEDAIDSAVPAASIAALAIIWGLMETLWYTHNVPFEFNLGYSGAIIMVNTLWDAIYDLKLINRIASKLLQAYPRIIETEPR